MALLAARYAPGEFNERRQRMARVPRGASLIKNPVSMAPGFQIENVFVLAGVPKIMQAMLEDVAPRLARGTPVKSLNITSACRRVGSPRISPRSSSAIPSSPSAAIRSSPWADRSPRCGPPSEPRSWFAAAMNRAVEAAGVEIEAMVRALGAVPERTAETTP